MTLFQNSFGARTRIPDLQIMNGFHKEKAIQQAIGELKYAMDNMCTESASITLQAPSVTKAIFNEKPSQDLAPKNHLAIRFNYIPAFEHGCPPDISQLKPILLADVAEKTNYIHKGRVLFVKTIAKPYFEDILSLLVQDEAGDCIEANLNGILSFKDTPNSYFPEGSYLGLLEPLIVGPEGGVCMRCDNPQCVVRFDSKESWLRAQKGIFKTEPYEGDCSPLELRKIGNSYFANGDYEQARQFYDKALRHKSIANDDLVTCLSNMAQVFLNLELWEVAELVAREALLHTPNHTKSKVRLVKSLIRQNKIEEAAEELDSIELDQKQKEEMKKDIDRLLKEQEGDYDFKAMNVATNNSDFHADFASPLVEFGAHIDNGDGNLYRGCLARNDIKKGSLISASKAFACIPEGDNLPFASLLADTAHKDVFSGALARFIPEVTCLLHRRPELKQKFFKLSDGVTPEEEIGSDFTNIDTKKIRRIIAANSFSIYNKTHIDKDRSMIGKGIWVNESYLNHSCSPNCEYFHINDHIFVMATKDIPANTELTISYVPVSDDVVKRREQLANWVFPNVGFECRCDYCALIRKRPDLEAITIEVHNVIREAINKAFYKGYTWADALHSLLPKERRRKLMAVYSQLPVELQHETGAHLQIMEGICLHAEGLHSEAHQCYKMATDIGLTTYGEGINVCIVLWRLVSSCMISEDYQEATKILKQIYDLPWFQLQRSVGNLTKGFSAYTLKYTLFWMDEPSKELESKLIELANLATE